MADLSSPVSAFIRECCLVGLGYRLGVDDLFGEWRQWAYVINLILDDFPAL